MATQTGRQTQPHIQDNAITSGRPVPVSCAVSSFTFRREMTSSSVRIAQPLWSKTYDEGVNAARVDSFRFRYFSYGLTGSQSITALCYAYLVSKLWKYKRKQWDSPILGREAFSGFGGQKFYDPTSFPMGCVVTELHVALRQDNFCFHSSYPTERISIYCQNFEGS